MPTGCMDEVFPSTIVQATSVYGCAEVPRNTTNSKTVLSKFPGWLYTMQLAMERDGQPGSPPIVP